MTPAQLQQLRDRLAAERQPEFRGEQYAHPRGWNDAFDFIERSIKEIMGESNDKPVAT
jgi:hypothetical protein